MSAEQNDADRLMEDLLSRIQEGGSLHRALSDPSDVIREFAVAITATMAGEKRGPSAPAVAGEPLVSDIEARQVEAYITESLSFPSQGDGRLAKDIMVAMSVMMSRLNAVDATVRSVAQCLHAAYRGSRSDIEGMAEPNLRAFLRQMVEARAGAVDALGKLSLKERERPGGQ